MLGKGISQVLHIPIQRIIAQIELFQSGKRQYGRRYMPSHSPTIKINLRHMCIDKSNSTPIITVDHVAIDIPRLIPSSTIHFMIHIAQGGIILRPHFLGCQSHIQSDTKCTQFFFNSIGQCYYYIIKLYGIISGSHLRRNHQGNIKYHPRSPLYVLFTGNNKMQRFFPFIFSNL